SGSGKTTLLRALAGLFPPAAGEIAIQGETVSSPQTLVAPHLRGLGLLSQSPGLWPHLTASANVALAVPASVRGRRARREAALASLARVGADGWAHRFPSQLSGGEQRLVELARTLAARPRVLLLDEPTAHVDLHRRHE